MAVKRTTRKNKRRCPKCEGWHDRDDFSSHIRSSDGKLVYDTYCRDCRAAYRRDKWREQHPDSRTYKTRSALAENTPKLDDATLALVSADPLWQEWLALPPREELAAQHDIAVQLQRKYRCDYIRLSHSMRWEWTEHWTKDGIAPYARRDVA